MSEATNQPNLERSREEKLKALIRKDVSPEVTTLAKSALQQRQEGSS